MTLDEDAQKAMVELREFYTRDELADFVKMCTVYKLPHYEAALFLRGETILEYVDKPDRPNIAELSVRTYKWYHEILIGGN